MKTFQVNGIFSQNKIASLWVMVVHADAFSND